MTNLFGPSNLIEQFIMSTNRDIIPKEWPIEQSKDWFLGHHPSLPAIRLLGEDSGVIGWFLGYPINEKGELLGKGDVIRSPEFKDGSMERVEQFIYIFGGRFLVVLVDIQNPRIYLDPCGSLSVVYCSHQKIIASTPNLIPYDDCTRDRVELVNAIGFPYTQGSYPFGLTPRYGVERILPNHFLDLSNWQIVRHWPKSPLGEAVSVEETVAEIATLVKRNIAAVVSKVPTYLKLTAGEDSRVLLACAKLVANRLELVTYKIGDLDAEIDCHIASRIDRRFGLKHTVLHVENATDEDLEEWSFRISTSTGEIRGRQ